MPISTWSANRGKKPHWQIIRDAATEVGPTLFYSLLVITVSFVPVFTLTEQAGRLFKPLAFTKTYAMGAAAFLSVTLVPVLMGWFIRGKIKPEQANPLNRLLIRIYHPLVDFVLRWRMLTLLVALVAMLSIAWPLSKMGSEFMPALYEGDLLYMPTTLPGLSVTKAKEAPAADRPDHPPVPGGRACLRQDRPGRDRHRSGPDDDDRNDHHLEARIGVAQGGGHALLFQLAGGS